MTLDRPNVKRLKWPFRLHNVARIASPPCLASVVLSPQQGPRAHGLTRLRNGSEAMKDDQLHQSVARHCRRAGFEPRIHYCA